MKLIRSLVCFAIFAVIVSPTLSAAALISSQTQERSESKVPLYLGTAWYPEQWPESRWDADLTLMEKAHIHFVRITEFAWSTMEPSEGRYDLDWVERAVRMAERHHIAVVLGTPSAAPPAWLTSKYPETLRTMEDGRKDQHGNRQQFDWANAKYRTRQFITTNMMGFFDAYDHYTVSQDLDLVAWDDYVGTGHLDPVYNGAAHDLMRGLLRKNFWVMETQPGFVNWSKDNNALNKGEVRAMAWHDVVTAPTQSLTGSGVAR